MVSEWGSEILNGVHLGPLCKGFRICDPQRNSMSQSTEMPSPVSMPFWTFLNPLEVFMKMLMLYINSESNVSCHSAQSTVHFVWQWDVGINITLHFQSTYLYGATPVMLAAGKGHTGVVDRIVHKYIRAAQELFTNSDSLLYCKLLAHKHVP